MIDLRGAAAVAGDLRFLLYDEIGEVRRVKRDKRQAKRINKRVVALCEVGKTVGSGIDLIHLFFMADVHGFDGALDDGAEACLGVGDFGLTYDGDSGGGGIADGFPRVEHGHVGRFAQV